MARILTLTAVVCLLFNSAAGNEIRLRTAQGKKRTLSKDVVFKSVNKISVVAESTLEKRPEDSAGKIFKKAQRELARNWAERQMHWEATNFYHRPLYFDYVPLERYGQSTHRFVQPWICGAHFFGTLPILPYKMGIDHVNDRVYTLGYYRPGSYAPRQRPHLPWDPRAAFYESGFWVALAFAFP